MAPRLITEEELSSRPQAFLKEGQLAEGVVKVMHHVGQGDGFITADDGSDWFFHKNSVVLPLRWDELLAGRRVKFLVGRNSKGPCAVQIHL